MASSHPPYVCPLDAATQQKAETELYEDPKNRQGAIDTFREWIEQQKYMKCPTDDKFLLGFLRGKHFSQLEARNSLEFLMEQRHKLPEFMTSIDTTSADMEKIINAGAILWLGRDAQGRHVALFRTAVIDYSKSSIKSLIKLFTAVSYYTYLEDEQTQVHGAMYFGDFHKYSMAKDMKFPLEDKRKMITIMQKTFPARVKGLNIFNTGIMIEFLMKLIMSLLNDKLKKRFSCHAHGLENVYKSVPMELLPEEYLPDDYKGPNAGTMQQCIDKMRKTLQSDAVRERIRYLSSDTFYINSKEKDLEAPTASFRKLNVD